MEMVKIPVIKLSFSDKEYRALKLKAEENGFISIQDYMRSLAGLDVKTGYDYKAIIEDIKTKFSVGEIFTIEDIEGYNVSQRFSGVFGKNFKNYIANNESIKIEILDYKINRKQAYRIIE